MRKLFVSALLLVTGCTTTRQYIEKQAAFDHKCTPEEVQILRLSDDMRSAEVDACGAVRRYQNLAPGFSDGAPAWTDVTKGGGS